MGPPATRESGSEQAESARARQSPRVSFRSVLALVVAAVVWGLTFAFAKRALDHFGAVEAAFLRLLFALPLLLPLAWARGRLRAPLALTVPLAASGMVGYFLLTHLALERGSVSAGAFVQALAPIMIALLAVAILRERPTRTLLAGIALAVAGACVLAWDAVRFDAPLGLAFFFLGTACYAVYTVLVRLFADRLSGVTAAAVPTPLGAVFLAGPAVADGWSSAPPDAWLLVAALGFAGSGIGFVLWNYGVARVAASYAGVFSNLPPVVAVVAAVLFLDDEVSVQEAIGGGIILIGALVASLRPDVGERGKPRVTARAPDHAPQARVRASGISDVN